jgi:hypothetical protein
MGNWLRDKSIATRTGNDPNMSVTKRKQPPIITDGLRQDETNVFDYQLLLRSEAAQS